MLSSPDPIAFVLNAAPFGTLAPSSIMMSFIPGYENPSKVLVHLLLLLYETATLWFREPPYPGYGGLKLGVTNNNAFGLAFSAS